MKFLLITWQKNSIFYITGFLLYFILSIEGWKTIKNFFSTLLSSITDISSALISGLDQLIWSLFQPNIVYNSIIGADSASTTCCYLVQEVAFFCGKQQVLHFKTGWWIWFQTTAIEIPVHEAMSHQQRQRKELRSLEGSANAAITRALKKLRGTNITKIKQGTQQAEKHAIIRDDILHATYRD